LLGTTSEASRLGLAGVAIEVDLIVRVKPTWQLILVNFRHKASWDHCNCLEMNDINRIIAIPVPVSMMVSMMVDIFCITSSDPTLDGLTR